MNFKFREFLLTTFFVLLFICLFLLICDNIRIYNDYNDLVEKYNIQINIKERCVLYDTYKDSNTNRPIANGLYWVSRDYYCVWAKDREIGDIEKTDRHEYCHYLVDNDYNHFCIGVRT